MTGEEWRRVKAVLADALALPSAERQAWIEEQLAAEPELAAEVRSLIAANEADGSLLEPPPAAPPTRDEAADAGALLEPGARVGAYRILREIGRGGMGVVFLCERADETFEREVALKLIQRGGAGRELERRFVRERRILARLDHPGIARLLDAGTTDDGRPYLVMEHVEGEPIDAYCRAHALALGSRLELFDAICSAVDFAHRNLVVHRDLKPSNVLVESGGTPKLLDFGIATILEDEQGLAGEPGAMPTRTGLQMMTPEYASPEQIRGEPITTATDVYALGVMLYELLAGRRPYELDDRDLAAIVSVVCGQDPEPPSTAVRAGLGRGGGSAEAADGRLARAERPELARRLRGDLDAIVLKALRKEPGERYRSAGELAADLRRYREGLPVEAHRGSFAYRAGKLVRRHRLAAASVAAFMVLLVVFAVAMAVQVARTTRALVRVEEEAAKAATVQAFLEETLGAADPRVSDGRRTTIGEALDRARERLETSFAGQPAIEASVQHLIGKLYSNLGAYDEAEPLLRQALATRRALRSAGEGGGDEDLASSLETFGLLLGRTGRPDEARRLLEEALALRRRVGDGWEVEVARDLDLLAHVANAEGQVERAVELGREALGVYRRVLGETSPSVAHALATVAGFERVSGDLEAAESALREAVAVLDAVPQAPLATRGEIAMDLGELLEAMGRYEDAEREVREGLDAYRRVFGEEHHWVAQGLVRLGVIQARRGRYAEAEENLRRGVEMAERVLGAEHPEVAVGRHNLAFLLAERGDLDAAAQTLGTVLAMQRRIVPDHPVVGVTLRSLGLVELRRGRPAASRGLLEEALSIHRRHYGEDHPRTARSLLGFGWALGELGDWDAAVALQRRALRTLERSHGAARTDGEPGSAPEPPPLAEARLMLAASLVGGGRLDEAEALLERSLPVLERAYGAGNHRVRRARTLLGAIAEERGRGEGAASDGDR